MSGRRLALFSLLLVCLTASLIAARAAPPSSPLPSPFAIGSTWRMADGTEVKIEEVQGDWLRVALTVQAGFAPTATWVYAPTGQMWRRF